MPDSQAGLRALWLALGHYTKATRVENWGAQSLEDDGAIARAALGFGDHAPDCSWLVGKFEPGLQDKDTGEVLRSHVMISSEVCSCGLHEHIDATLAEIAAVDEADIITSG